jgi:hypothetical protein
LTITNSTVYLDGFDLGWMVFLTTLFGSCRFLCLNLDARRLMMMIDEFWRGLTCPWSHGK